MQMKVFAIPIGNPSATEDSLNAFLRSKRIVNIDKRFVENGANSFWTVLVEYLVDGTPEPARRNKVDYKQVLTESQFSTFSCLRDLRKRLAEEHGVPVYAVFTNEQLAAVATTMPTSKSALSEIAGIGKSKVEHYGDAVIAQLGGTSGSPSTDETSG